MQFQPHRTPRCSVLIVIGIDCEPVPDIIDVDRFCDAGG
jgi:hypothetical protein